MTNVFQSRMMSYPHTVVTGDNLLIMTLSGFVILNNFGMMTVVNISFAFLSTVIVMTIM
ncbi:hypothetical protein HMI01_06470 [Halolactibacillus miurensis]|uniref:Uncharacterized protein n=2 Tax=Halolactibacillus TaxID=306539 RepID=A0ABQ0VRD6_9BACI|nr:hypothetical protein [Halolactibacillus miurensis]GEM03659.1 hypothetical protein HMI01_06470 [Halolactibacillus miurensis]